MKQKTSPELTLYHKDGTGREDAESEKADDDRVQAPVRKKPATAPAAAPAAAANICPPKVEQDLLNSSLRKRGIDIEVAWEVQAP